MIGSRKAIIAVALLTSVFGTCAIAGCAPNTSVPDSKEPIEAETTSVAWSTDSDCASCHQESLDHATVGDQAGHQSMSCTACHVDTAALETVHEDASGPSSISKLKKTEVTDETCLSCHGSYEELAQKTTDDETFTDDKGTVVNPHTLLTSHNANNQHENVTCSSCHETHSGLNTDACTDCHHENIYECYTCHE